MVWILFSLISSSLLQLFYEIGMPNVKHTIQQSCPNVDKCIDSCPYGFIMSKDGCQTCECNPCRYGQPLYKSPCGRGKNTCTANNGLCKVNNADNAYCCPNERSGSCPSNLEESLTLCSSSNCKNDFDCSIGKKCCGSCLQCVNATLY